ncbi:MAG: iron-sulfur cluster assembly protein [Opitutales bacterium]
MTDNRRILSRDVEASVIPAGDMIVLPGGTKVDITHRLGGNFTVVCDYGMFRVNGKDADALGEEIPTEAGEAAAGADDDSTERPSQEVVWEALKTVYDPEIPVNIVDLGLVYSMEILPMGPVSDDAARTEDGSEVAVAENAEKEPATAGATEKAAAASGWRVEVKMTLTAPGCGMGPVIADDARTRVLAVRGVKDAQVDIVWDPPWEQSMISEEGKMELGLI